VQSGRAIGTPKAGNGRIEAYPRPAHRARQRPGRRSRVATSCAASASSPVRRLVRSSALGPRWTRVRSLIEDQVKAKRERVVVRWIAMLHMMVEVPDERAPSD